MPIELPDAFNGETWEPKDEFTLVDEGVYRSRAFKIEKKVDGKNNRYYEITFRIDGGEFDGEDVIERYVGLAPNTIFRLYGILQGMGEAAKYYDADAKKWKALPDTTDLQGKAVYIKVEHEAFQPKDKDTDQPRVDDNGQPVIYNSPRITRYYDINAPKPDFKPSRKRTNPGAPTPAVNGAANVMAGLGATPAGGANEDPW